MDATCRFGIQYQPSGRAPDPIVATHVRNCPDCQAQVVFLDDGALG